MHRRHILFTGVAAACAIASPTLAWAKKPSVYTGIVDGLGAGGYDVVSYTQGEPTMGDATFTADYDGATWHFTTAENLKTFQVNPAKYTPAYGGYCAFAVAHGATAKGDPKVWTIVDGKLYLNLSASVQSNWKQDIPGNIASANANWPKVLE